MILCTNCGTRNQDDSPACETCGRKLQSRWSMQGGQNVQNGAGQNGNGQCVAGEIGQSGEGRAPEPAWQALEPILRSTVDDHARKLVHACAETWVYALMLMAGAGMTMYTEDWWYLAGGLVVAAGLAWARGI